MASPLRCVPVVLSLANQNLSLQTLHIEVKQRFDISNHGNSLLVIQDEGLGKKHNPLFRWKKIFLGNIEDVVTKWSHTILTNGPWYRANTHRTIKLEGSLKVYKCISTKLYEIEAPQLPIQLCIFWPWHEYYYMHTKLIQRHQVSNTLKSTSCQIYMFFREILKQP